ncbi:c-type cytochrome [Pseudooceanicola algae]|uniref:Cytochrome c-551 n=1 Tax=Pseudooceanicola algae TaxID=1537215 RepID=A0A418SKJ7_9RHOB|nr:cytochrome C [Pseudooceanicola algae]QPM89078.1 Cytochrome c-551 [Pseudooceanicola algae]
MPRQTPLAALSLSVILSLAGAAPGLAGDPAAGEADYKKCRACHKIQNGSDMIQRGGPTGPNLYGVIGRQAGIGDFRYGADLIAAGETGLIWTEENLAAYVTDPRAFVRDFLDDSSATVKMSFKLPRGQDDIAAYLASVAPEADGS